MTITPNISVIMSTYNNEETILDATNSILDQEYPYFELLIVNDYSNDGTQKKLSPITDPRLKIINNNKNLGLTLSLNKAISLSTGRFIARQDADDISMPDRLKKQLAFMESHPEVAVLGTGRATLDKQGKVLSSYLLQKKPQYTDLLKKNCFVHGSVMMRREVLEDLGMYNEDFRYTQDYELWLRISKKYHMMNIQEPLYGVRRHSNRVTLTRLPQALLYKLLAKNMSLEQLSPDIISKIREHGIEAYYPLLNKKDRIEFHKKAKSKYLKNSLYSEAKEHLIELLKLNPFSAHSLAELAYLNFKLN